MGQYNLVYTVPIKSLRLEKTSEKWQKKKSYFAWLELKDPCRASACNKNKWE